MRLALALLLLCGCTANQAAEAGSATAWAALASVGQRATGGCFSDCAFGTECNRVTGFCERIPCGGECTPYEHCDTSVIFERCVPNQELQVEQQAPPAKP